MILKRLAPMVLTALSVVTMLSGCSQKSAADTYAETTASPLETSAAVETDLDDSAEVSLWAGSMDAGYTDGSNDTATFFKPYGLCAAPGGGLLIVDCYTNLLRASSENTTLTLAGNTATIDESGYPVGGYLNGASGLALLNRPRFATLSAEGAVVFSDTGNHCIRVLKDGVVRLIAGKQEPGFSDGSYDTARFNTPSGVAIGESGTIYVADTLNHCIREISASGQVTTLAGIPGTSGFQDGIPQEALFCEPNDIQLGPDGALYVVDKGNQRIRRITGDQVTTVAGSGDSTDDITGYITGGYQNGKALDAQFQYPTGLYITTDGVIYVADTGNHCIRSITPEGMVTTVAGTRMSGNVNGPEKNARFNQPLDVYCEGNSLYVSDSYNHVIRLIHLPDQKGSDIP